MIFLDPDMLVCLLLWLEMVLSSMLLCYDRLAGDGSFLHAIWMDIVLAGDVLPPCPFVMVMIWLEMFFL